MLGLFMLTPSEVPADVQAEVVLQIPSVSAPQRCLFVFI